MVNVPHLFPLQCLRRPPCRGEHQEPSTHWHMPGWLSCSPQCGSVRSTAPRGGEGRLMLYNNLPGVPIMNSHQHSKHILHALHSTQQRVSVPLLPSVKLVSNLFVLRLAWPIINHCLEMLCSS